MTVITVTTVGFSEIVPMNDSSRLFTIGLIFTSIAVYGYLVKVISDYFSNSLLIETLRTNRMLKKITKLNQHTIICGYGRNGQQAVIKLQKYGKRCVIVEKDSTIIKQIIADNLLYVEGDATKDESLQKAGIAKAENLVTTFSSDSDNLYVVLSARQLNSNIHIVSRSSNESSLKKMKIAGANQVVLPNQLGGEHMAAIIVTPDLVEFVATISSGTKDTPNLVEVSTNDFPKKYLNKSIRDLDLRRKTGCNIIGFVSPEGKYIINPNSDVTLTPHSNLIVLATPKQINLIKKVF